MAELLHSVQLLKICIRYTFTAEIVRVGNQQVPVVRCSNTGCGRAYRDGDFIERISDRLYESL